MKFCFRGKCDGNFKTFVTFLVLTDSLEDFKRIVLYLLIHVKQTIFEFLDHSWTTAAETGY